MSLGLDDLNVRYVYRVLRPDEDPNEDIACKAPHSNRSISEHIATGLRTPSKFISTTSSLESAHKWLQTSDERTSSRYGNRRTTIIRIDVGLLKQRYPRIADSAVDLTTHYNRNVFLEDERQMRFAGAYKEVLFVGRIPSEAVSIEYKRGQRIVPNESSVHNVGNITSAAVSLRAMQHLDSHYNSVYYDAASDSSSDSPQNEISLASYQYPSYHDILGSLQQTRNVDSAERNIQWKESVRGNLTTRSAPISASNSSAYRIRNEANTDRDGPTFCSTCLSIICVLCCCFCCCCLVPALVIFFLVFYNK